MDIGQAIKDLRTKQGMSQEQLADSVGMSVNAVSSWETGKSYPPKATLERVCRAFGITPVILQLQAIEEGDFPEEKKVLFRALLEPLRNELTERKD